MVGFGLKVVKGSHCKYSFRFYNLLMLLNMERGSQSQLSHVYCVLEI